MSFLRVFKSLDVDGISTEFIIKFITEEYFEDCVNFMNEFFIPDEAMCKVRNFAEDQKAMEENSQLWRKVLAEEKISIGCFKVEKDCEKLIAANFLYVKRKSDVNESEIKSKNLRDIFTAMHLAEIQFDVWSHYKVDVYLASVGLAVHSEFRGKGIAVEMLKAREEILRFLGLKLTSTQFTGVGSQKSAIKAGFEENSTVTYAELQKINNELDFPGIEQQTIKTMSFIIDK